VRIQLGLSIPSTFLPRFGNLLAVSGTGRIIQTRFAVETSARMPLPSSAAQSLTGAASRCHPENKLLGKSFRMLKLRNFRNRLLRLTRLFESFPSLPFPSLPFPSLPFPFLPTPGLAASGVPPLDLHVRRLMSSLITFARQVRSRSNEHRHAMELLSRARLAGQMVSVLRQELDSMVRVIYLLAQDIPRRTALIESSVAGKRWLKQNSRSPVTDKEMVELAQHLRGWTSSVYKFGCAFIHLSNLLGRLPSPNHESSVAAPKPQAASQTSYC
jgi:hypothetical protein